MSSFPVRALLLASLARLSRSDAALDAFESSCASAYTKCLSRALDRIQTVRRSIDEGSIQESLGAKASEITNEALESFGDLVPDASGDASKEKMFDAKLDQLTAAVDTQLEGAFLRQMTLLRAKALKMFKKESLSGANKVKLEYDAYKSATKSFKEAAEKSVRPGSTWDYSTDLKGLQDMLKELYLRTNREEQLKKAAQAQMASASTFVRIQQQQIQMYQNQLSVGGPTGWHTNLAYHVPDTPVNLVLKYQPGVKKTLQIFTQPEVAFPPLGNNHFVEGVTPFNIGLSANVEF